MVQMMQQTTPQENMTILPTDRLRVERTPDGEIKAIPFHYDDNGKPSSVDLSWYARYGWATRIPDRELHKTHYTYYLMSFSDYTVQAISEWPIEQVEFASELLKAEYLNKLVNITVREDCFSLYARMINGEDISESLKSVKCVDEPDRQLKVFQKLGAYIFIRTNCGVWFEQGCGKTATAITGLTNLALERKDKSRPMFALIICPPNLILNWKKEFDLWSVCNCKVADIRGPATERMFKIIAGFGEGFQEKKDLVVVIESADSITSDYTILAGVHQITGNGWDAIIQDECHGIKDPRTNRSQNILKISQKFPTAHKANLTGTPIGNHAGDLWAQLEFLDKGCSGHKSYASFKSAHTASFTTQEGIEVVRSNKLEEGLRRLIANRALIVRKSEVLKDLPDKVYSVRGVTLSKGQRKFYEDLAAELFAEIEADLASSGMNQGSVMINHPLTKLTRLAQITSGFASYEPPRDMEGNPLGPRKVEQFPFNPKIEVMKETLQELLGENEKFLIWSVFEPTYDPILDSLNAHGLKTIEYTGRIPKEQKDANYLAFNEDRSIRGMLLNAKAGGTGLNLLGYPPGLAESYDTDCTIHINFSHNFSWLERSQAEDRSHRQGTRKPLQIVDLIAEGTIDEVMYDAIRRKKNISDNLTDVKNILSILKSMSFLD